MTKSKELLTRYSWVAKLLILALLILAVRPAALLAQDDDPVDEEELVDDVSIVDDEESDNFFCASELYEHPIAASIADSYDVDYDDVKAWFCEDGLGLGQIALALHTAKVIAAQDDDDADADDEDADDEDDEPVTAEELLAMRLDGYGWGQIWQEYGFVGRPRGESMGLALGRGHRDLDADDEEDGEEAEVDARKTTGRPDHAGRPDNPGASNANGGGRPDNLGASNSGGGRPDSPGASSNNGKGGK